MGKNGIIWVGLFLWGCNPGNQTTSQSSAQYAAGPASTHNQLKENFEGCRRKFRVYWDRCIRNINELPSGIESCPTPEALRNNLSQAFALPKSKALEGKKNVSAQDLGAFAKDYQALVIQVFEHWTRNHRAEAQDFVDQTLVPCNEMGNIVAGYVWDPGKPTSAFSKKEGKERAKPPPP